MKSGCASHFTLRPQRFFGENGSTHEWQARYLPDERDRSDFGKPYFVDQPSIVLQGGAHMGALGGVRLDAGRHNEAICGRIFVFSQSRDPS